MKKLEIEIPVILPGVPDEKDACVQRLIERLQYQKGLEKVHVADQTGNGIPKLCFHYNPDIISIEKIEQLARQTGAVITEKYGHKLIEAEGIRHTRHARKIENNLKRTPGILEASVSAAGMVRLEFDTSRINEENILLLLEKEGLEIPDTTVSAQRYLDSLIKKEGEKHEPEEKEYKHEHRGIFGKNTELIFSIVSGALLGIGFGLSFLMAVPAWISLSLYIAACFFGGFYTAKEAVETVFKGGFEIDFLMLVAAAGAATLGAWAEGALLLFLFSLGHSLEHYAMNKARKSIAALTELAPKTAIVKRNGKTEEIGVEDLHIGDIVVVKPDSKISADGIVIKGESSVNQASITGESIPVDKFPVEDPDATEEQDIKNENRVFSGTINGNNTLEIKVIKDARDSTLSHLVRLVNEAQTQKSPTQLFTDKFEKYLVPSVLILVVLLNFAFLVLDEPFSESFYRAMAVLVAASPCALAISTPSAVLSGVARAARSGVLIKGGRPLENLGILTAIAFDKTGTLTEGKPKLTKVVSWNGISEDDVLKMAVSVESLSDHPLAKAIVRDGRESLGNRNIPQAENLESFPGKGIKAKLDSSTVYIGNRAFFEKPDNQKPPKYLISKLLELEENGNTTMIVRRDDQYVGLLALMDTPRKDAKSALEKLKNNGIRRMVMLTGDNQKVADSIASQIGITEAWGDLLPEQKVEAIKELKQKESKIAMVGDGVNDAPAMAHSTVGIAMGAAGSDVALETADIALMANRLETLPFAIGLSRKAKKIIKQNLWISLGVIAMLIPLTLLDIATIGPAVLMHEGSTVIVVFNALRLLAYKA